MKWNKSAIIEHELSWNEAFMSIFDILKLRNGSEVVSV